MRGAGGVGEEGALTVIVIIAHDQLLELAVLAQLAPYIFVEGVEVVLELGGIHAVFGVVSWVLIEVWHEYRLAV